MLQHARQAPLSHVRAVSTALFVCYALWHCKQFAMQDMGWSFSAAMKILKEIPSFVFSQTLDFI
jgi:hypothetical protein